MALTTNKGQVSDLTDVQKKLNNLSDKQREAALKCISNLKGLSVSDVEDICFAVMNIAKIQSTVG